MEGLDAFMTCDCCKKNPAPIRISDVEGNAVTAQFAICTDCMTLLKRLVFDPGRPLPSTAEAIKQVQEMLSATQSAITVLEGAKPPMLVPDTPMPACPNCGMTLAEFKQRGRFGCANDYEAFAPHIDTLLERIHDVAPPRHKGRAPQGGDGDGHLDQVRELGRLKQALDSAVKAENYEEAARLRDRITALSEPAEKTKARKPRKRKEGKT